LGIWIGDYLGAMVEQNRSSLTIRKHREHLNEFAAWCDQRAIYEPTQLTHPLVERYHKELHRRRYRDKPLNPAYIGRHLIAIRRFCAWLYDTGVTSQDVAAKVKLPRRLKTIPHSILTQEEIEKIMAQADTTDILGIRNRTILELLWATGIRTGELCRLCLTDVDLQQKTVYIMASPGAQERTIPVTAAAHHWLEIYLEQARPQLLREQQNNALFLGRYGSRLSQVTLATTIHGYFKKAGVDKNGNCRIFRHTLATTMLENGADIRYLQQILGHRSLNSTQIYAKVSIRKLKEVHNQAHPTSRIGHPEVEKQDP
jgi:integrase/recombinase XerD